MYRKKEWGYGIKMPYPKQDRFWETIRRFKVLVRYNRGYSIQINQHAWDRGEITVEEECELQEQEAVYNKLKAWVDRKISQNAKELKNA
jgi:hypothetical protein